MRVKNSPLKRMLWSMFSDLMINAKFGRPVSDKILDKSTCQGKVWDRENKVMTSQYIEGYWSAKYPFFMLSNKEIAQAYKIPSRLLGCDGTSVSHNSPNMHDCDGSGAFTDVVCNPFGDNIFISMKIKDLLLDGNDRCVMNESADPKYIKMVLKSFETANVYFTTVGLVDQNTLKVTCINLSKLVKALKDDYRSPVSGNKLFYTVTRRSGPKAGYIQLSFKPSAILKRDSDEKAQNHHDKCMSWYCDKGIAFSKVFKTDTSHAILQKAFESIL